MLSQNIKTIRTTKGLSQDELAIKLNVVRQTISKWERGLSVPDSEMLIQIAEVFETPVSTLLGENIAETEANNLSVIAHKLEVINLQLAQKQAMRRKWLYYTLIFILVTTIVITVILLKMGSPYLNWNYDEPQTAVVGVFFHGLEWLFVRLAPIIVILAGVALFLIRKRDS